VQIFASKCFLPSCATLRANRFESCPIKGIITQYYVGQESKRFAHSVAQLVRKHFDAKFFPIYKTTKTKSFNSLLCAMRRSHTSVWLHDT